MNDIKQIVKYTKNLNILYVEDNAELRKSTKDFFENYFDSLDTAMDGHNGYEQYMKFYEANNVYYDLVISDIAMPNMDGTEMSKLIFMQNHKQHILIISAYNDSNRLQELINMGITNYIHKPLNSSKFISVLKNITDSIKNMKKKEKELSEIEKIKFNCSYTKTLLAIPDPRVRGITVLFLTALYEVSYIPYLDS